MEFGDTAASMSVVIVKVSDADLTINDQFSRRLTLAEVEYLKGQGRSSFNVEGPVLWPPKGVEYYLVFLTEKDGDVALQNRGGSLIGLSFKPNIEPDAFSDSDRAIATLIKLMQREKNGNLLLELSYLAAGAPDALLNKHADEIRNTLAKVDKSSIESRVAAANVALHLDGVSALRTLQEKDILDFFGNSSRSPFENKVASQIVAWAHRAADKQNSSSLLEFAQHMQLNERAGIISAVAPYLDASSIQILLNNLQTPNGDDTFKFSCWRALMYIANSGKGIVTFDEFSSNPEKHIHLLQDVVASFLEQQKSSNRIHEEAIRILSE